MTLRIAALLLVVGVIQIVLTQLWAPLGLVDGLMVAAGLLALRLPFPAAVGTGALAGLVQDSLSGGLIGLHAFSKTVVTALLTLLGTSLMVRGQLAEGFVIGVAALIESAIVRALLLFLGWPGAESSFQILGRGLVTGAVCSAFLVASPRAAMGWRRWRMRSARTLH